MAIKHNQQIPNNHFRKDWQRRVRCHFDQPGKKLSRRIARREKAVKVAPRPIDKLRPIVRCPTIKYNRRVRLGRGFTLAELKAAGIPRLYAPTIGIAVDHRRQNLSEESLVANVERLKAYKERLIVFPRRAGKVKNGDTPKDQLAAAADNTVANLARHASNVFGVPEPIRPAFAEVKKSDMPAEVEGGAYKALHKARMDKKLLGRREKRAREKAEEEKAKK